LPRFFRKSQGQTMYHPHPTPLPSREREYRKNIPLKEEGVFVEMKDVYHSIHNVIIFLRMVK
jgi:hypothetical protein